MALSLVSKAVSTISNLYTHTHFQFLHYINRLGFFCFVCFVCVLLKRQRILRTEAQSVVMSMLIMGQTLMSSLRECLSVLTQTFSIHSDLQLGCLLYFYPLHSFMLSFSVTTDALFCALTLLSQCSAPYLTNTNVCHVAALYCPQQQRDHS